MESSGRTAVASTPPNLDRNPGLTADQLTPIVLNQLQSANKLKEGNRKLRRDRADQVRTAHRHQTITSNREEVRETPLSAMAKTVWLPPPTRGTSGRNPNPVAARNPGKKRPKPSCPEFSLLSKISLPKTEPVK